MQWREKGISGDIIFRSTQKSSLPLAGLPPKLLTFDGILGSVTRDVKTCLGAYSTRAQSSSLSATTGDAYLEPFLPVV